MLCMPPIIPRVRLFLAACDKYGLLVVECIPGWQYFNEDPVLNEREIIDYRYNVDFNYHQW